jgi:hypothetical protein
VLVRFDGIWPSRASLVHVCGERDVHAELTVGSAPIEREHGAVADLSEVASTRATDFDGEPRERRAVAELTGLLAAAIFTDYAAGMRVIVRRGRPRAPAANST